LSNWPAVKGRRAVPLAARLRMTNIPTIAR
jgi:hypothetical protein